MTAWHSIHINPAKCILGVDSLEFLGHQVDKNGIWPLDERVWVIKDYSQSATQSELHSFLGLINFCHRFIPGCAYILQPLSDLSTATKKGAPLQWTDSRAALQPSSQSKRPWIMPPFSSTPTPIPLPASWQMPQMWQLVQCCSNSSDQSNSLLLQEVHPSPEELQHFWSWAPGSLPSSPAFSAFR